MKGLKEFKEEIKKKEELDTYVPITMDELMLRFVINLRRGTQIDQFDEHKKLLEQSDLRFESEFDVKQSVEKSLIALKKLIGTKLIDEER